MEQKTDVMRQGPFPVSNSVVGTHTPVLSVRATSSGVDVRDEQGATATRYLGGAREAVAISDGTNGHAYTYTVAALNDWGTSPDATTGQVTAVAAPLDPDEFLDMAREYLESRWHIVTGNAADAASALSGSRRPRAVRDVLHGEGDRCVRVRDALRAHGISQTDAQITFTEPVVIPARDGELVTLRAWVTEAVTDLVDAPGLDQRRIPNTGTRPYVFRFVPDEDSWCLDSVDVPAKIESDDSAGPGDSGNNPDASGPSFEHDPSVTVTEEPAATEAAPLVDANKVAQYALDWSQRYNPDYHVFDNDCTDFASQASFAGGMEFRYGFYWLDSVWWFQGIWPLWASHTQYTQAVPGDILFWRTKGANTGVDHASVITYAQGNDLRCSQHSGFQTNKSIYTALAENPGAVVYIAHLTG